MLGSPFFLFRTELGTKDGDKNILTVRGGCRICSGRRCPTRAFDAAARGAVDSTQVLAQAQRLMADPRSAVGQERLLRPWLALRLLSDKTKDPAHFPDFTRDLLEELRAETSSFFLEAVRDETNGSLTTLLTADYGLLSEAGARFYGVPWEGPEVGSRKRVTFTDRSGLLTQASLLALGATSTEPVAILRGKLVRTRLLCQPIPAPPADAAAVTAALPPPKDNRERASQLLSNPSCAGCHRRMDPIGLAYEGFGAVRRRCHRTHDGGWPQRAD